MIEAEEYHSLLSTNIAQIVKLCEACTTAEHSIVWEPPQHTTKDPSASKHNHNMAPPAITDYLLLEPEPTIAQVPKRSPSFQS